MLLRSILSEAWRSFRSGTTRGLLIVALLCAPCMLPGYVDVLVTRRVLAQVDNFTRAGGDIFILSDPGQVNGSRCSSFAGTFGIQAAGAIRSTQPVQPIGTPSVQLPTWAVTSGFRAVVNATQTATKGVLVSDNVAERLVPGRQGLLYLDSGRTAVSGKYSFPDDGRDPTLSYAVLVPSVNGVSFDQCWIKTYPYSADALSLLRTAVDGRRGTASDNTVAVNQLNSTHGVSISGADLFSQRITAHGTTVTTVACFIVGLVASYSRRLDVAAALHLGMRRRMLILQLLMEAALCLIVVMVASKAVFACEYHSVPPVGQRFFALMGWRYMGVACVGFFAGVAAGALFVRERRYLTYSKSR